MDDDKTGEFRRGWDAALLAVRHWHEAQAAQATRLAGRSRFPKNLEREAEVHRRSAEAVMLVDPNDV